jgi:hypothetical protein
MLRRLKRGREGEPLNVIRRQLPLGTTLYADEAESWIDLHARYEPHRIHQSETYTLAGRYDINANAAEGLLSRIVPGNAPSPRCRPVSDRLRRAGWREDPPPRPERQAKLIALWRLAMRHRPTEDFCGY